MKTFLSIYLILTIFILSCSFAQNNKGSDLFKLTTNSYSETDNLSQAVKNEYGDNYRIADWNDIVSYCQKNSPEQFINNLNLQLNESDGIITWNKQGFWNNSKRHFFISRFDHNKPGHYLSHANIDNHHIDLGSWFGLKMPILCIKNKKDNIYATIAKFKSAGNNGTYVQLMDGYLLGASNTTNLSNKVTFKKVNETTILIPTNGYSQIGPTLSFNLTPTLKEKPDYAEIIYYPPNNQNTVHLQNGTIVMSMGQNGLGEIFKTTNQVQQQSSDLANVCLWFNGLQAFILNNQSLSQKTTCSLINLGGVFLEQWSSNNEQRVYFIDRSEDTESETPAIDALTSGE